LLRSPTASSISPTLRSITNGRSWRNAVAGRWRSWPRSLTAGACPVPSDGARDGVATRDLWLRRAAQLGAGHAPVASGADRADRHNYRIPLFHAAVPIRGGRPFHGRPEELLTRPPSVLQYIDRDDGALCALAEQRPDIKLQWWNWRGNAVCLVATTRKLTLWMSWSPKSHRTPDLLLMVRSQLRERVNEYIHLTRRRPKSQHHSEAIISHR